jgi:hypothetical protein
MNELEELIAKRLSGSTATKSESKFDNFTMYTPDVNGDEQYIGNYSMPDNFSEVTKANIKAKIASLGIRLQTPGTATKKDISF